MRKKYIRFRGEASPYLCFPRMTKVVLRAVGSDTNIAELQLEGVRPEDIDGKTIVIDVKMAAGLKEPKTQVLRREDLTDEDWIRIRQQELTVPYRDQYD
jgi:hypothetical protein